MLKIKSVAKLIETTLNNNNKDEKFRVVYGAGSYKGSDINCILKQGKGTITPVANYTNVKTPFSLEIITPMQYGEDRVDEIVDIVNEFIKHLNGKVKNIDGGKAVFLFNPLEIGQYETRATAGQSVIIRVEFFSEYSTNSGTKYEMALLNNPFHTGSQNTKYHTDLNAQINWFDKKIKKVQGDWLNQTIEDIIWSEVLTPNVNSLVVTSQRYLNPIGVELNSLLMMNYAVIKETKPNQEVNYYYYDITNSSINEYNLLMVDLKMDTVQTVYFNPNFEFTDCQINKAHLSRVYRPATSTKYLLDFRENSPLFERENIRDVSKRPTKKLKLNVDITNGQSTEINKWFEDNVSHWVYYYLSGGIKYKVKNAQNAEKEIELNNIRYVQEKPDPTTPDDETNNIVDGGVVVLVAPVYKTGKKIYLPFQYTDNGTASGSRAWDISGIKKFLSDNDNYAKVVAIKNSLCPPMYASARYDNLMSISGGNLYYKAESGFTDIIPTLNSTTEFYDVANCLEVFSANSNYCYARVIYQDITENFTFYHNGLMHIDEFKYEDIMYNKLQGEVDDLFAQGIEPKLLNEDYSTYRLYIGGNTYDLPVSKTSACPKFIYKEILSPDITKAMLIYDPLNSRNSSNVFTEINTKDFTGFMINIDLSMWFTKDALDSYLATNKNNLQIMQNNQNAKWNQIGINAMGSALTTSKASAWSGLVGVGTSILSFQKDKETEMANYNLTLDNMAQSPQTLSALNSNALLIQSVDDLGIYIELHQPLSREKEMIVESFKKYGYTLNKIGKIKDYDHIRANYNYVEATIENVLKQEFDYNGEPIQLNSAMGGEISNAILEDLRQRFAQGVRFWVGDRVDYSLPNNEVWVEEDI